ncbi:hypothetical protein BHE74_00009616 [Ensete ventricosum]|nr:hypothetical protein BHE74_00009616 [Ensete ventricosum]
MAGEVESISTKQLREREREISSRRRQLLYLSAQTVGRGCKKRVKAACAPHLSPAASGVDLYQCRCYQNCASLCPGNRILWLRCAGGSPGVDEQRLDDAAAVLLCSPSPHRCCRSVHAMESGLASRGGLVAVGRLTTSDGEPLLGESEVRRLQAKARGTGHHRLVGPTMAVVHLRPLVIAL